MRWIVTLPIRLHLSFGFPKPDFIMNSKLNFPSPAEGACAQLLRSPFPCALPRAGIVGAKEVRMGAAPLAVGPCIHGGDSGVGFN